MSEELKEEHAPSWMQWITDFDKTRKLFVDNYNALAALRPWVVAKHPEMLAQHDKIMQDFRDQIPAVDFLTNTRNTVASWLQGIGKWGTDIDQSVSGTFQNVLNFTGVQAGLDRLKSVFGLNGLGFAPIVVAVGVVAATAMMVTIAALVKDAYVYSQRLNALKAAEDRGATPQEAAKIVNSVLGAPGQSISGEFLGLPINAILLTAAAVFLGPPLIQMLRDRR